MEDNNENMRTALVQPPPIPVRENSAPPPIPPRKGDALPIAPLPIKSESTTIPVRHDAETATNTGRRRPVGAVATVMVSGEEASTRIDVQQRQDPNSDPEEVLARNPYDLNATVGSTVTASYPFHGEENLQQLSFAVSSVPVLPLSNTVCSLSLSIRYVMV